jgi:hypothetical protein
MSGNTRGSAVEKLLGSLDDRQQHEHILSYVQYPKTRQQLMGDAPTVTCHYTCAENICDFMDAMKCIDQSVGLRALGCQKIAKLVSANYSDEENFYPCYQHAHAGHQGHREIP